MRNRTIFTRDNLEVLRGMDSESADLIYLDPPFNSNRNYAAPIGSEAAGAAFRDTWTLSDLDVAWIGEIGDRSPAVEQIIHGAGLAHSKGMQSYLVMMAVRLFELRRVLAPTGSIYLHCDPTASHYLKALMDSIFGASNFRNEVVWHYYNKMPGGKQPTVFPRSYDQLLMYGSPGRTFHPQKEPRETPRKFLIRENVGGIIKNKRDASGNLMYRVATERNVTAVWAIPTVVPASKAYTGYPTQKPLKLLERIISASSNEGDLVLDPFCGCATTAVAAEKLGRKWIGIDLSSKAIELVRSRLERECGGLVCKVIHRTDLPRRSDLGKPINYKTWKHQEYGRCEGVCIGCDMWFPYHVMTLDHIEPKSRGGADHESNWQLLCSGCNALKGDRPMEWLRAERAKRKARA